MNTKITTSGYRIFIVFSGLAAGHYLYSWNVSQDYSGALETTYAQGWALLMLWFISPTHNEKQ